MAKCFCVGSILHFVIATGLLTCLLVNVFQITGNQSKCRHEDNIFDISEERRDNDGEHLERKFLLPLAKHLKGDKMNKMHERMKFEGLGKELVEHRHRFEEMMKKCAISRYDSNQIEKHVLHWISVAPSIVLTFVVGILGSGFHCSTLGHRKLGLKIASIVIFIIHLLYLVPCALFSLGVTIGFRSENREFHGSYYKGRCINGFIMVGLLFFAWLVNLIHSFVACCCTPTEDEETIKVVRMNKNTSDDRLKLVDNVVFGERVFDNDGEIA
ncbi:DgyrCDS12620 [Dimorphilus gyrociliatus]|uniref:DgyrCDS12620 n=1 Tax=Dimorphilus gyrociliatus TaxID=2664684 RepID=A0A7I8W7Z9_9ANNE|nr:DgyrCDS12620 [Dimorphilus gyrociliatus]